MANAKPPVANPVGPGAALTHEEWQAEYRFLNDLAEKWRSRINALARKLCADAGLDPNLLGIHPHNALCGYNSGNPWSGVDYNRVIQCKRLMDEVEFAVNNAVTLWDRIVRVEPHGRQIELEDRLEREAELSSGEAI